MLKTWAMLRCRHVFLLHLILLTGDLSGNFLAVVVGHLQPATQ